MPAAITEASGVAVSRRNPNLLWVHNDDAPVVLFALDTAGALKGRVRVPGIDQADFEDIAVAPCETGSCVFIGDIGDNMQTRKRRVVYRIPEPSARDTVSAPPTAFPFHLPGKAEDAEALFIRPGGHMYIISKGRSGPITVYEFPSPLSPDSDVELKAVYHLSGGLVQLPDMVTGAGVTPDGRFIIIRTYSEFQLYNFRNDTLESLLPRPFDLQPLGEPQGEGVDIDDRGNVYLVSEKSLGDSAPPLSRVQCHLPS